jgi:hypothetical protein
MLRESINDTVNQTSIIYKNENGNTNANNSQIQTETNMSIFEEPNRMEQEIGNKISDYLEIQNYECKDDFALKIYNGNDILISNDLKYRNRIVNPSDWLLDTSVSNADSFTIDNSYDTIKEGENHLKTIDFCKECEHCMNKESIINQSNLQTDLIFRKETLKSIKRTDTVRMVFENEFIDQTVNPNNLNSDNESQYSSISNANKAEIKVRKMNMVSRLQKNIENSNANINDPRSFYKKWLLDIHSDKIDKMDNILVGKSKKVNNRLDFLYHFIENNLPKQ